MYNLNYNTRFKKPYNYRKLLFIKKRVYINDVIICNMHHVMMYIEVNSQHRVYIEIRPYINIIYIFFFLLKCTNKIIRFENLCNIGRYHMYYRNMEIRLLL